MMAEVGAVFELALVVNRLCDDPLKENVPPGCCQDGMASGEIIVDDVTRLPIYSCDS